MLCIQELLNESRFSGYQKSVFLMCFLIVLFDGFDTAAIGYVAPALVQEWGVSKPQLGPVLSAALFGLAAGALISGPLADRFGRRLILIGATFVFAIGSLICARVGDLTTLVSWRFITGVGLGAAIPNAVTLISEYSPARRRAFITNAMFCGFPLGAALGGFLAAWLIPNFGWRSVFIVGGAGPLLVACVLLCALPESIRHMVVRQFDAERIRAVLRKITPKAEAAPGFYLSDEVNVQGSGARVVLAPALRIGTFMLWIAYFMGLVIFYAMINWLPLLLQEAKIAPRTATLIASLFALGGVGAIVSGWLMDRYNANWTIASFYALTALGIALIGFTLGSPAMLMALVFVAGAVMNTAQSSMPALAAAYYPTRGRGTGVAWMLGVGRFGGIAGSFLVGWLSQANMALPTIFLVVAIPGAIAALAIVFKQIARPEAARITMANAAAH